MWLGGDSVTKRLYLMQGIPGSGKSTMAGWLVDHFQLNEVRVKHLSTDDWRYAEGMYVYDPETNKQFHTDCQKACVLAMQEHKEVIIVDNTNITQWQADPYIALARIYDYEISVMRVECDPEVAIQRQERRPEDRRVPAPVISSMYEQMERLVV